MLFGNFRFQPGLNPKQKKKIKPKHSASVIKLKDLKSMIFEHQNHILREFRVLKSFKSKKQTTTYEKKERKKNVILIIENEKNKRKKFMPCLAHLGVRRSSLRFFFFFFKITLIFKQFY